ncbi:MAG: ABC transporter ATP-binding protein [Planctomycetes bacterium]|nr:ABC transporter ATP-binding protein [Planctomycetota bacterium]MBI3847379.1 ABC transporter ATP-binding protein [Planctomycetota bacterium]
MSSVRFEEITHRFESGGGIERLSLEAKSGELLTLLGPSGCGKTTTLRIVAGFARPDSGRLAFDGIDVTSWPPENRGIGMVFQSYALFPHLDVFDNVAFGLRTRRVAKNAIVSRVKRSLELVGLSGTGTRSVQSLSGGQQQRVALARAIVVEPRILLLDEPLSNLDMQLREETRAEIRRIQRTLGITTLYVTHDREEALAISDRIAVLRAGRLEQVGTPSDVFERPSSAFVAGFVSGANVLAARLERRTDGRSAVALPGGRLETRSVPTGAAVGAAVAVAIRPSAFRVCAPDDGIKGRVARLEYGGESIRLRIEIDAARGVAIEAVVPRANGAEFVEGAPVALTAAPADVLVFSDGGAVA